MYEIFNAYLENGLKIVLHRLPAVRTVACGLWVKQGSCYEDDANNGLSHLAEHLIVNPDRAAKVEYAELMDEAVANGVVYNAATTKEYTYYYLVGLKRTLHLCLSALACIAKENRSFSEEFFDNEKKVVMQEAIGFYSSFQQIKERTGQALWGDTGIGKIIMGNMDNVSEATQEEIYNLINASYVPENAVLVVVGDIEYRETMDLAESYFADWIDRRNAVNIRAVEDEPGIYFNQTKGPSVVLSVGFRAPSYGSREREATEIMTRMIGSGNLQSRLAKEIRMKRGLSYTLGSFSRFYKNQGTIGFTAVCSKEKVFETAEIMMEVLKETREHGFSEEEIAREKNTMKTSLLLSVDNIRDHLQNIGKSCVLDRDFYIEKELREIENLEKDEIENITGKILQEENMGLAVIGECDVDKILETVVLDGRSEGNG